MSVIRFPQAQIYDNVGQVVVFSAHVSEEAIRCAISLEALEDRFQANLMKPLQAFISNRPAIEHIAERLIERRRFEADGSVLIRTADC